jgi:hypothetical protein
LAQEIGLLKQRLKIIEQGDKEPENKDAGSGK